MWLLCKYLVIWNLFVNKKSISLDWLLLHNERANDWIFASSGLPWSSFTHVAVGNSSWFLFDKKGKIVGFEFNSSNRTIFLFGMTIIVEFTYFVWNVMCRLESYRDLSVMITMTWSSKSVIWINASTFSILTPRVTVSIILQNSNAFFAHALTPGNNYY